MESKKDSSHSFWSEDLETKSPNALRDLELRLLRQQISLLKNKTRFYASKLENFDLPKSLEEFQKFPFTLKDELRESQKKSPPFGLHQACDRSEISRVYMTSGTTGKPTFIGLTQNDLSSWIECASRCYWAAGFRPNNWVVSSLGAGPFIAGTTLDGWKNIGSCLIPVGPGRTDRILAAFEEGGADCLSCTPSYALYLLEHCEKNGIDPKTLGIKKMQFGGEPGWQEGLRSRIEGSFGCVTTESLGMGDVSVDFWGECAEERNGMHFCGQGIIYPELIDPESLERIEFSPGAEGELVYTHLTRECEPLVRFRSRDLVRVISSAKDGRCSCGRTSPKIRVLGRSDEMFKVKAVTVYPSSVKEVVRSFVPRVSGELEIFLTRPQTQVKAPVKMNVELGASSRDSTSSSLAAGIEEEIHDKLLFRAEITLVPYGTLSRSEYKTKLVRFVD